MLAGGSGLGVAPVGLLLAGAEETSMTPEQLKNAVVKSSKVANAVNRRFSTHRHGLKEGVARAVRGNYVNLTVDPAYKNNLTRYFQVVRAIELKESPVEQKERIAKLRTKLLDPATSAEAAIKLEAIGKPAADVLIAGTQSHDPRVQCYAAEALAYLDYPRGGRAAGQGGPQFGPAEPGPDGLERDARRGGLRPVARLARLPSAETRYGAFRA